MSPEPVDTKSGLLQINSLRPFSDLEESLRRVHLKDWNIADFNPYLNAKITLEKVKIGDLHPCALYVLSDNLRRVGEVGEALNRRGIDIFNLNGGTSIVNYDWGDRKSVVITPPIIEVSPDDGGIQIITDGLHRVTRAKMMGREEIVVVKIENTAAPLPAFPVGWDEVQILDQVPQEKRKFRFTDMRQIRTWIAENYDRLIQGFSFPELNWMKGVYPETPPYLLELSEGRSKRERAAAIITKGEKVLMVKRADSGLWGLPAGAREIFDDDGKFSHMAVRRELVEETGLVALEWRLIEHIFGDSKIGYIYEVKVTDNTHINMDIEEYVQAFNKKRGNSEVSGLGLFTEPEVISLNSEGKLFKPHYNLVAIENYFRRKNDGSLDEVPRHYSPWDAPDIFWNRQESFPYFPPVRINSPEDLMRQINF